MAGKEKLRFQHSGLLFGLLCPLLVQTSDTPQRVTCNMLIINA